MDRRALAIAAGMLLDVADPVRCVEIASDAGFDALGLRFVGEPPTDATIHRVQAALQRTGLFLLDVEMVVLGKDGTPAATDAQVIEAVQGLRPRHLTTVMYHPDHQLAVDRLGQLCDAVNDASVVPALEFLPFSGVRRFEDARAIVEQVGPGRAAVLVDALHVTRSGDDAQVVAGASAELVPYVQFCDAPAHPPAHDDRSLYHEAVAARLLPGTGELPLHALLQALPPDTPLSLEVLSEPLMRERAPLERAIAAREATLAVLEAVASTEVGP